MNKVYYDSSKVFIKCINKINAELSGSAKNVTVFLVPTSYCSAIFATGHFNNCISTTRLTINVKCKH